MNRIEMNLNCKFCIPEIPEGVSASEYGRLDIGLTKEGYLQIWCNRHNIQVGLISDMNKLRKAVMEKGCAMCNHPMGKNPAHTH